MFEVKVVGISGFHFVLCIISELMFKYSTDDTGSMTINYIAIQVLW